MTDSNSPNSRHKTHPVDRPEHLNLKTDTVSLGYHNTEIITNLTLQIPIGQISVIIGANGSGKSTLLRGIGRLLKPANGTVLLDGKSIHSAPTKTIAKRLGLLPQSPTAPDGITVADLVSRGRYPHQRWFRHLTTADNQAITEALTATSTLDLADRPLDEISGGQRQRVWIAMALAQQTDILLLDEPTTFLDLAHQLEVLDLLTDLNHHRKTTIVLVMHDLNLACRYADHLIAMQNGTIITAGSPKHVVDPPMVQQLLGVTATITDDPVSHTPTINPISRHHYHTP